VKGQYDCPPQIRGARANAWISRHAADNARVALGTSTGQAGQQFFVSDTPVVPGSARLQVKVGVHFEPGWEEKPDFDRSGPLARNFVVMGDTRREIIFGDGRNGYVPETGSELSVSWQTGGGGSGNVPANTLTALPAIGAASTMPGWAAISAAIQVQQPAAAVGGADEETLSAAKARAVRLLAESRCAVTQEDYERLACAVPGVPVARARAVAEFHPRFNCLPAAGCVTLVVMSACARRHPEPTQALCRAVQRYLDARRPVAVELHITGPRWTRITVRARLRLGAAANATIVRAEAARGINAFLDPLTGGPDGTGWPIGRSVYRSEIYAVLQAVDGVVSVDELALRADDNSLDLCNNLELCPHGMPLPGVHEISTIPGSGQ
jgi:predicted phage baseplate assembly protein